MQPIVSLPPQLRTCQEVFSETDDMLLLLGLAHFQSSENRNIKYQLIASNLLPTRSAQQITEHVKYARRKRNFKNVYKLISEAHDGHPIDFERRQLEKINKKMSEWNKENLPDWFEVNFPERCPVCHKDRAYFMELQTRSADEPATIFYRCANKECGHRWKE